MIAHFDMIMAKTIVCPCEMEATFKAFFNVDGTEFDSDGFLNILVLKNDSKEEWIRATDEQVSSFISHYENNLSTNGHKIY